MMKLIVIDKQIPVMLLLLIAGAAGAYSLKKLSFYGAITGAIVGFLVFEGTAYTGLATLAGFFLLGTAATSFRKSEKKKIHTELEQKTGRTAAQVLANGGIAGLMGLIALMNPAHARLYIVMMTASLASASSDTLSSELGTVYGKNFYNILSFKRDTRGQDGVVSLEGSLFGLAGAALIGLLYYFYMGWSSSVVIIVVAGVAGNLTDSLLGAGLERKELLKNNMVNFLSTLIAAAVAAGLYLIF